MNSASRYFRILIASLAAACLMVNLSAAPLDQSRAIRGLSVAHNCCATSDLTNCCGGSCCRTPAPNPGQPEKTPLQRTGERDRTELGVVSNWLPAVSGSTASGRQIISLADDSASGSLISQHVRLQI